MRKVFNLDIITRRTWWGI